MKSVRIGSYSAPYSSYSVRIRDNTDQNNSEYGHYLRSVTFTFSDPIDFAVIKYKNHRSIFMINSNVSFELRFRFKDVSENDMQQEVLN